jgi:hypothetical protein
MEPSTGSQVRVALDPGLTGLRLGEVQRFQLVTTTEGVQTIRSNAMWTTDRPDICGLTADGTVRALTLGTATITAIDDQYRASLPIRVVPNVEGDWSGLAQFIGDRCLRGTCPPSSGFVPQPDAGMYEVGIHQTHDRIAAADMTTLVGELFDLAGQVDSTGLITLAGSRSLEGGRLDLSLTGQLNLTTQHIAGHYELTETLSFVKEFDFRILDLAR